MEKKLSKNFIIAQLILSIFHFIPASLIMEIGLVINIVLLIMGSGSGKMTNASDLTTVMGRISIISVIPSLIILTLFILTIICTVKSFLRIKIIG